MDAVSTSPRRAVASVARQLIYTANKLPDAYINNADVRFGSKLSHALLQLSGQPFLNEDGVRDLVRQYAGKDARVGVSELRRLQDDIRDITRDFEPERRGRWPGTTPVGVTVRMLMSGADINFDGRVTRADVTAGSDWAGAMLDVSGRPALDARGIEEIARESFPSDDPNLSLSAFHEATTREVTQRAVIHGHPLGSLARGQLSVFDNDQDLRLTQEDGRSARITLELLGDRDEAHLDDIRESLVPFDKGDGLPGTDPDGRLGRTEMREYHAARAEAAKNVPAG